MPRLYGFVISHFTEKARWALDMKGVDYEPVHLLPGPHMLKIRRLAKGTSVPVFVDGDRVVQGSSAIIDHADGTFPGPSLTPETGGDRARELEELADQSIGRGIQRLAYADLLADRKAVVRLWTQHGPAWGSAFYFFTYPVIAREIRRMYGIIPERVARARDRLLRAMDELDHALGDRPFFFGDAPSRVDITVSALLAPLCAPPEHVVEWPSPPPANMEALGCELEGRPTWNHVFRMYREHRGSPRGFPSPTPRRPSPTPSPPS